MFHFVAKLLMQNQLKLEKEGVWLLGERLSMLPSYSFVELQKKLYDCDQSNISYDLFKSTAIRWVYDFKKKFSTKREDVLSWAKDSASLAGWGNARLIHRDWEKNVFIFKLQNSAIAESIVKQHGKTKEPVDHMFRGLVAGTMSALLNKELDAVEITCAAMGHPLCQFIVQESTKFDFSKDLVKMQLQDNKCVAEAAEKSVDSKI